VGCPVVVKPRSSTGSVGVKLCATPIEAAHHTETLFREIAEADHQGVLVEKFVSGPEYSVEIFDGVSIGVTQKLLGPPPAFVEVGHAFPSPGPRAVLAAIAEHAERAVAATGYSQGPAHVELRLASGAPTVIEINPRLAGGMIPELVRRATGVDLITTSIRFACGMPYELSRSHNGAAAIRFLLRPTPAPVQAVEGLSDARSLAGIVDAGALDRAFGHAGPIADFRDRLAYVIAEALAPEEAGYFADRALTLLHCVSAPHSMEVDDA
jgi:biotin carboxylase